MEESSDDELQELPTRKEAGNILLGEDTERQLQLYLKKIRDQGGVVTASIAIAAARGISFSTDSSRLAEFGGYIELSRQWAYHFLGKMKFVRRKATTSKSRVSPVEFEVTKNAFLDNVMQVSCYS